MRGVVQDSQAVHTRTLSCPLNLPALALPCGLISAFGSSQAVKVMNTPNGSKGAAWIDSNSWKSVLTLGVQLPITDSASRP